MKKSGCLVALVIVVLFVVALLTVGLVLVIAGRAGYSVGIPDVRHLRQQQAGTLYNLRRFGFPNLIPVAPAIVMWGAFASMGKWLFTFAVAIAAHLVFPRQLERLGREAEVNPLPSLGWGVVLSIVIGLLCVLFAITIIGIPLALLLAFSLGLARAFGLAGVGLSLGRIVRERLSIKDPGQPIVDIGIGLAALMILSWVPILGWLASLAAGSTAVGAAYLSRLGTATS